MLPKMCIRPSENHVHQAMSYDNNLIEIGGHVVMCVCQAKISHFVGVAK